MTTKHPSRSPGQKQRRRWPNLSIALSGLALFVVLGGSAAAATSLIHAGDIAPGAVTGKAIRSGAVEPNDLSVGTRALLAGAQGAGGAKGEAGAPGSARADGTDGATGAEGAKGTNGTNGTNGANGANGPNGANGANGPNGANGVDGTDGIDGTNGTNGADGTNGTNGANGTIKPLSANRA